MNRKTDLILFYVNLAAFALLFAAPIAACAAVDASMVSGGTAPASVISPWTALIPLVVPIAIALLKTVVPKIPGVWLPIMAPLLGAGADIVMHFAGVSTLGPLWGAVLGSAGVGLRELQDQLKQAVLPDTAAPASNAKR